MKVRCCYFYLCSFLLVSSVWGQVVEVVHTSQDTPIGIPDDAWDGTGEPGTAAISTITVPEAGIISSNGVSECQASVLHTFIGDVIIHLEHNGTEVTLLSRPGLDGGDDGTGCCGDSSNFDPNFLFTFLEDAAAVAETMGSGIGDNEAICDPNNAAPCDYKPNEGDMADSFQQFAGMPCEGDWTFTVGDSTSGDTGTLFEWAIAFECIPPEEVPTVSGWGLIVMTLLVLATGTILCGRLRMQRRAA